jgi:hypothetical protein
MKRIFKYLKGTTEFGIWYPKDDDFTRSKFNDVDWVGDVDDRKITSCGALFLGNNLISWMRKTKNDISFSTIEAKYIAAAKNVLNCYG